MEENLVTLHLAAEISIGTIIITFELSAVYLEIDKMQGAKIVEVEEVLSAPSGRI